MMINTLRMAVKKNKDMPLSNSLCFFVTFLILFAGLVQESSAALAPVEVAKQLQKTYERTDSIKVDFRQVTTNPMSRRVRRGSGVLVIAKPGLMRWDYGPPEPKVLICDGKKIIMYLKNEKQMITSAAEDYLRSDVTYAFFTGKGNILKDFDILTPDSNLDIGAGELDPETYLIKMIPKVAHPQVEYLHVWVAKKTFLIERLQIVDQFGSVTDLYFSKIKRNKKISPDYFKFTPPPDTELIQQ